MPSLDTNILIRWLIGDVPAQSELAEKLLASGQRFTVDDTALLELVYVLERTMRLSRQLVADSLGIVLSTACLDIDRAGWSTILDLYVARPKLSATDLYLAQRAQSSGATPLYTFDRKLAGQLEATELLA